MELLNAGVGFSLKKWCQELLQEGLDDILHDSLNIFPRVNDQGEILPSSIPVKRIIKEAGVSYGSAIAPRWSRVLRREPIALARDIVDRTNQHQLALRHETHDKSHDEPRHWVMIRQEDFSLVRNRYPVSLRVASSGWIVLDISDRGVAAWLQSIMTADFKQQIYQWMGFVGAGMMVQDDGCRQRHRQQRRWDDAILRSQYAHARCCMWLRMAQGVGVEPSTGCPWLDTHDQLRMGSGAAGLLTMALIDAVDDVWSTTAGEAVNNGQEEWADHWANHGVEGRVTVVKWLEVLSEKVLTLQAQYPLMEVIGQGDRPTVECLVCLISITQDLLCSFLTNGLHAKAPDCL